MPLKLGRYLVNIKVEIASRQKWSWVWVLVGLWVYGCGWGLNSERVVCAWSTDRDCDRPTPADGGAAPLRNSPARPPSGAKPLLTGSPDSLALFAEFARKLTGLVAVLSWYIRRSALP